MWWKDCATTRRVNQNARKEYRPRQSGSGATSSSTTEEEEDEELALNDWDKWFKYDEELMILKQLNLTWKCLINFNSCVPIKTFRVHTILSWASAHWHSQLNRLKLGVGGYTEEVLKWFNYLRTRAHPGMQS